MKENSYSKGIITNPELSTNYVDYASISGRNDDLVLLRFFVQLPEGMSEQSRVLAKRDFFCKFIDTLCKSINYYPKPTQEE